MSPFTRRPPSVLISLDGSSGLGDRPWPPAALANFTVRGFRWSTDMLLPTLIWKTLTPLSNTTKGPALLRRYRATPPPDKDTAAPLKRRRVIGCLRRQRPHWNVARRACHHQLVSIVLAAMATRRRWTDQTGPEVLQTPCPLKKLHRWTATDRTRVRNQCSRLDVRAEGGPV